METGEPHQDGLMRLNIRTLTGQSIPIDVPNNPSTTVMDIKRAIQATRDIPMDHQRLIFTGKELQDGETLVSYNISNDCAIHLLLKKLEPPPGQENLTPIQAEGDPRVYGGQYPAVVADLPVAIAMDQGDPYTRHQRLIDVYRLSRAVKLFAVIDGVFLLLWALTLPYMAIAVFIPIAGYYGAMLYKRPYIWLYMLYLMAFVGLRIYWIKRDKQIVWMLIFGIGVLIEIYIFKIVYSFDQLVKTLDAQDRQELHMIQNPARRPIGI